MEVARKKAAALTQLSPKPAIKDCVLAIADNAENFLDHDSRAKLWQAIRIIQGQQLLQSSAEVTEPGMLNAQNLAYHMLIAAAKMTGDPKGFTVGMQSMGCAKDAIMIVYASRAKFKTPQSADKTISTGKPFEKTNHMPLTDLQKTLRQIVRGLRRSLKQSPKLKAAKIPLNRVNFYLSVMELGVDSLKDVGAQQQAAKQVGKFIFGFAKSIVTMKVDSSMLEAGKSLASAGMKEKRRMNAERVFKTVAYIDRWRRDLILLLKAAISTHRSSSGGGGGSSSSSSSSSSSTDNGERGDVLRDIREARLILCHLQQVASWEPRFEVPTAFIELLGDLLQIDGISTLADGEFATWLWTGDKPSDLARGSASVGALQEPTELSKVSIGSRRLLEGQPCEILEVKTPVASAGAQPVTTEATLVKVQCMDGTVSGDVRVGDTVALETFNGLYWFMSFGEPPSLQYRKENTANDNLSSEQLQNFKNWGTELKTSVLTGNQPLKEWIEDGIALLKAEFSSMAESVEKMLQDAVTNASSEATKLLMSRLSHHLQAIDPANLKQTEAVLLATIASATTATDLTSATATKLHGLEALCSPVLHAVVQAHTMISKIAKCNDPFSMLLAKLLDMVERVGRRVKEAMTDVIDNTHQEITSCIEQKLGAAAEAVVNSTASALDELYANSAVSSKAKQVHALFNRLDAALAPDKDVTSKRSLGIVAMESFCHGLTAQLQSLDGFTNLIKSALPSTADTTILQTLNTVHQSFTDALALFHAVRDQVSSFMAPVVSATEEWARYAHTRLLKKEAEPENAVDHKGNVLVALKEVVEKGSAAIEAPIQQLSDFIKGRGLDVVDKLVAAINAEIISQRNTAKIGVLSQAYNTVHTVICTVSNNLARVIGVLEDLLQQCGAIRQTVDESVRPSVQGFAKKTQAVYQMVQSGFVGRNMLTEDKVEEMLQTLIQQCNLAKDTSSTGSSLADEVSMLGGMLDGLGSTVLDALSAASPQFNIEIELELPDFSALKGEMKDMAADMAAAAEDFVDDVEEKIGEVAADAAELLEIDADGDDDDDDGMEEESGAFSSALVKDGFNLMKSFWTDKNARKNTWRVRECAAYQALLLMTSLSATATPTVSAPTTQEEKTVAIDSAAAKQDSGQSEHTATPELVESIQQAITQRKAMEAVPAAKRILSQPEFVESIHAAMQTQWKTQEEEVQQQIDTKMKELDQLREDIVKTDDPDKKAKLLVLCKQERKRLQSVLRGVGSVGAAIDVVIGFLSDMTEALEEINGKLDAIAKDLQEMKADMKDIKDDLQRLTGLSIVEKVGLVFESIIRRGQRSADEVHIEIDGLKAGPDKDFKQSNKNSPFPLVKKLVEVLTGPTEQDGKKIGTVLVAGQSGSGKSLIVLEMESLLAQKFSAAQCAAMELAEKSVAAGTTTEGLTMSMDVVVRITLPELSEPLTEMVEETLTRRWQCTAAQITDLRRKVEQGQIRLIFILDGYDELRPQLIGKNLYKTNNLEKWRSKEQHAAGDYSHPKVVVFVRSELLTGLKDYHSIFVPLESDNEKKDEVSEAETFLTEYRIAPFTKFGTKNSKVDQYIAAHVAVETQVLLGRYFGVEKTLMADYLLTVASALHNVKQDMTSDANGARATDSKNSIAVAVEVLRKCRVPMTDEAVEARFGSTGLQDFVRDELSDQFWTPDMYFGKFEEMEELQKLTRTAFMMKILCNILPRLVAASASPTATKRELILLLNDEDQADVLMNTLRKEAASTREELLTQCGCESHNDAAASEKLREVSHAAAERWTATATIDTQPELCSKAEALYIGALKRVFQRRPRTRFAIFAEFVTFWVAREAEKLLAGTSSTLSAAEMIRDAPLLAEALAVQMTIHSQPKVTYEQTSQIAAIKKPSVWDKFFDEDRSEAGQALVQVRKAAPIIQNGNVYAMAHKSVQEYLVANCLTNEMASCVEESQVEDDTVEKLKRTFSLPDVSLQPGASNDDDTIEHWILTLASTYQPSAEILQQPQPEERDDLALEARRFGGTCIESRIDTVTDLVELAVSIGDLKELGLATLWLRVLAMKDINRRKSQTAHVSIANKISRALGFDGFPRLKPSDAKEVDAVKNLVNLLDKSLPNTLVLSREEAVVDFIADRLLGDLSLVRHFGIISMLSIGGQMVHGAQLQRVAENMRTMCFISLTRREGQCLGHLAAIAGNIELLRVWISCVSHTTMQDLHIPGLACASRHTDVPGSLIDICDALGCSPLARAAQYGQVDAIDLLVQSNADVHATDTRGWRVLMHAAKYDQTESVESLLKNGVATIGTNATNATGQSALWAAAAYGAISCCRLLAANNPLDAFVVDRSEVRPKEGATTATVSRGVVAIIDGRVGTVTGNPNNDAAVRVQWLDSGVESELINVNSLTSVFASLRDLTFTSVSLRLGESNKPNQQTAGEVAAAKGHVDVLSVLIDALATQGVVEAISIGSPGLLPIVNIPTAIDLSDQGLNGRGAIAIAAWFKTHAFKSGIPRNSIALDISLNDFGRGGVDGVDVMKVLVDAILLVDFESNIVDFDEVTVGRDKPFCAYGACYMGMTSYDLSFLNLQPQDAMFVCHMLNMSPYFCCLEKLLMTGTVIGEAGPRLVQFFETSSMKSVTFGTGGSLTLPFVEEYESDVLECTNKDFEFGATKVIAWWLTRPCAKTVTHVDLSGVDIGPAAIELIDAISPSSTLKSICVGGLTLPLDQGYGTDSLNVVPCSVEVGGAIVVAWWLTTAAGSGVRRLSLSGNVVGGHERPISLATRASVDKPGVGYVIVQGGEFYEIVSLEDKSHLGTGGATMPTMQLKMMKTGEVLTEERSLADLQAALDSDEASLHAAQDVTVGLSLFDVVCKYLSDTNVTSIDLTCCGLTGMDIDRLMDTNMAAKMENLDSRVQQSHSR
eukprot:COSAG01_NODE_26_length_36857_cov_31.426166_18_plen_2903_part_00